MKVWLKPSSILKALYKRGILSKFGMADFEGGLDGQVSQRLTTSKTLIIISELENKYIGVIE